ncbi:DNA-directed DNA polymerase [Balamuthia mandrillaris]
MALQGGILERFWELANLDPAKRHSGAKELIGSLVELQQRSEKTAAAGTECCQELTYSVKRLVRGLASSREGARQGYALALTELLHTFPIVTIDSVFKLIDENLIPSNNAKGQEEKDAHFGNLFGLLSIIRSQRLNLIQTTPSAHQQNGHSEKPKKQKKQKKGEEKEETTGGEAADEKEKLAEEVVRRLFELSSKKSFLAEVCHCAISGFLEQLTQRCFETHVLPLFLQHVLPEGKKPSELSPESLALAIAFQQRFTFDMRKSCGAPWATGDILQPSNLSPMTHACKESLYVHPKVHSLWDAILAAALPQAADHQKRSPNYDFLVKLWAAIAERKPSFFCLSFDFFVVSILMWSNYHQLTFNVLFVL